MVVSPAPASPGFVQLVPTLSFVPPASLMWPVVWVLCSGRVGCVGAAVLDGGRTLEAVVGVDLILKLGVISLSSLKEGPFLAISLSVERTIVAVLVDSSHLERDQGGVDAREAHLHAYVLRASRLRPRIGRLPCRSSRG